MCVFCGETILHISRAISLFAGGSIDAENISILYLDLSKDITTEKEGTTVLNLQE
jgi:hypothetical protein